MTFKEHALTTLVGAGVIFAIAVLIVLIIFLRLALWVVYVPYWLTWFPSIVLLCWLVGYGIRRLATDEFKDGEKSQ